MANFYNIIKNFALGRINADSAHTSAGLTSEIVEAGRRALSYFSNSRNKANCFLSIFSAMPWFITDHCVTGSGSTFSPLPLDEIGVDRAESSKMLCAIRDDLMTWFSTFGVSDNYWPGTTAYHSDYEISNGEHVRFFVSLKDASSVYDGHFTFGTVSVRINPDTGVVTNALPYTLLSFTFDTEGLVVDHARNLIGNVVLSYHENNYNFWDVLAGMTENVTIMDCLSEILGTVISDSSISASSLYSVISKYSQMKYASVRDIVSDVIRITVESGPFSAITYVINYFQSMTTAEEDEQYNMTFTDNSKLIPQDYYQGWVDLVGSVVTTISTVIAATGHFIVGAIGAVLGVGLTVVGKILNVDPTTTIASLNYYGNHMVDCMPIATGQRVASATEAETVLPFLNEGSAFHQSFDVPGGKLFVGLGSDGQVLYEFHPDIHWRLHLIDSIFDITNDSSINAYSFTLKNAMTAQGLVDLCDGYDDSSCAYYNDDTGVLNSGGNNNARLAAEFNTMLYIMYCNLVLKEHSQNSAYRFSSWKFFVYTSGTYADQFESNVYDNSVHDPAVVRIARSDIMNSSRTARLAIVGNALIRAAVNKGIISIVYGNKPMFTEWADYVGALTLAQEGAWDVMDRGSSMTPRYITYGLATIPYLSHVLNYSLFVGYAVEVANNCSYCIKLPRYSASSFWATIIATAVVSVAIVVAAVCISLGVRKMFNKARYKRALDVERAHTRALADPSSENMEAYMKAVTKNNLFATVFGGTKYSKGGLWGQVEQSDNGSSKLSKIYDQALGGSEEQQAMLGETSATLSEVIRLIKGPAAAH